MVGALTNGRSRFGSFFCCSHSSVDCGSVRRVEVVPSPLHKRGESFLVGRDPSDCIGRGHRWRKTGTPPSAAGQSFENVAPVSRPRSIPLCGRVALWFNTPTRSLCARA
jgi:hypothetical protein